MKLGLEGGDAFFWPTTYSPTASFADGSATATVALANTNDRRAGGDHSVTITLAAGDSYTVGTANSVAVTIRDDDSAPGAPAITYMTPRDRKMFVAWSLPTDLGRIDGVAAGFNDVIDLEVEFRGTAADWDSNGDDNPDREWRQVFHNWSADRAPIEIQHSLMEANHEYEVRIRVAAAGNGPWSAVATGRTLAAAAPAVTNVNIGSSPASGDTYGLGEEIVVNAIFDAELDVTGTPRLLLLIGGDSTYRSYRWAEYDAANSRPAGHSGTANLKFRYTVRAGDADSNGISIDDEPPAWDFIDAAGGSIRAYCANTGTAQELADCRAAALYANLGIGDHAIANAASHKVERGGPGGAGPERRRGLGARADAQLQMAVAGGVGDRLPGGMVGRTARPDGPRSRRTSPRRRRPAQAMSSSPRRTSPGRRPGTTAYSR